MLKYAEKAVVKAVPVAKPRSKPVDIREVYRDTMTRYPQTMALLAE